MSDNDNTSPIKVLKRISNEELAEIIFHIAAGDMTPGKIIRDYHITTGQLKILKENNRTSIAELSNKLLAERNEIFNRLVIEKRAEIAQAITKGDIKKASLTGKARAIADLTNVKRLEAGESTQNIDVATSQMDKETLLKYIIGEDVVEESK